MTDETREQIERDADKLSMRPSFSGGFVSAPADKLLIAKGMIHQHPIAYAQGEKEGWNAAIEEALIEIEHVAMGIVDTHRDYSIIKALKNKLESLKK